MRKQLYAEMNDYQPSYGSWLDLSGVPLESVSEVPPGAFRRSIDYSNGINPREINSLDLYYEQGSYGDYMPQAFTDYYDIRDEPEPLYEVPYNLPLDQEEIVYQSDDEEAVPAPEPEEDREDLFVQRCKEKVHLPTTKTPVIDTVAMLATLKLSCKLLDDNTIQVTNAADFLHNIRMFCKKKKQTTSDDARVKALSRWFQGIPYKRKRTNVFTMRIKDSQSAKWKQSLKRIRTYVKALALHR